MVEVFVIPLGPDRYELYCEHTPDAASYEEPAPTGVIGRLRQRFATMLREAEARRHEPAPPEAADKSWATRVQRRLMAWVAERIAEQRLLWSLRRESQVTAAFPADLTFTQARTLIDRVLHRDHDRHRRWLAIDAILGIASGALMLLPGPNIVFYYFAFRVVGHWLSMQGAKQGLTRITWVGSPCPPLSELRDIGSLQTPARDERIRDVSDRLRLKHLPTFFERVAI